MSSIFLPLDSRDRSSGTPFNCVLPIDQPIRRDISKVSLLSLELPYSWYNVRPPYNTLTVNNQTLTITPGEYDIYTLCSTIRSASGNALTLTHNPITSKVSVALDGIVTVTPSTSSPWCVARMLGFSSATSGSNTVTAQNVYNLAYDLYVHLLFQNLPSNTQSRVPTTFRVPLNSASNSVFYLWANNSFAQHFDLEGDVALTSLKVLVQDRFGNSLDSNGVDWSALLKIETRV